MSVNFSDIERLKKDVEKIKSEILTRKTMVQLAEHAWDALYKRVKSGYGVNNDTIKLPKKQKFDPPLSPDYVEWKKTYSGPKGEFFKQGKNSNLTLTGQMLDSIDYNAEDGRFSLILKDTTRDDGLGNREVYHEVRQKRPFFALTDKEQKGIINLFRSIVRNTIDKYLK